jgi:hypothetical protein
MGAPVALREDFDGVRLRALAKAANGVRQELVSEPSRNSRDPTTVGHSGDVML